MTRHNPENGYPHGIPIKRLLRSRKRPEHLLNILTGEDSYSPQFQKKPPSVLVLNSAALAQ